MRKIGIIVILLSLLLPSCNEVAEKPLFDFSKSIVSGIPLVGHQDSYYYGHSWENVSNPVYGTVPRSDYYETFGKWPDILGSDLGHIELASDKNIDGVPFRLMRECIVYQDSIGKMATLSWHPRNPLTGGDAWDVSSEEVVKSILPGGEKHELFLNNYLKHAADFLLSLRRADGSLVPVIFRPWHEHTGSWFWWGRHNCSTEEYVALWKMTHDYFDKAGLDNLFWAYSPDKTGIETYMERYPGDDMVDLFGLDAYMYNIPELGLEDSRKLLREKMTEWISFASNLAAEHNKPFAVTETGWETIPDTEWYTEILLPAMSGHKVSYCLFWRNAWDKPNHFYLPYPGHKGVDNFMTAFKLK